MEGKRVVVDCGTWDLSSRRRLERSLFHPLDAIADRDPVGFGVLLVVVVGFVAVTVVAVVGNGVNATGAEESWDRDEGEYPPAWRRRWNGVIGGASGRGCWGGTEPGLATTGAGEGEESSRRRSWSGSSTTGPGFEIGT